MKIGVLGGTFDPVHNGHIAIASKAMDSLALGKVLFIPALEPPLKNRPDVMPVSYRLEMLRLAIANKSQFEISTVDVARPGPSYTVDTLLILRQQYGRRAHLFFIMGWDSLIELPEWKQPQKLIKLCKLVALTRNSAGKPDMRMLEAAVPGLTARTIFLDIPPIDISSTDIRNRVANGISVHGLVPDEVERYIKRNRLYSEIIKF